jgi:hypothetical protein
MPTKPRLKCRSRTPSQAIHSLFFWRILEKTILFSGFKKFLQKFSNTRVYSWIAFCRTEIRELKTVQKLESEKTLVYAQKSTKNVDRPKIFFKNSVSGKGFLSRYSRFSILDCMYSSRTSYKDWIVMYLHASKRSYNTFLPVLSCLDSGK